MRRHTPDLSWRACLAFVCSFTILDWVIIALIAWMVVA
jgi:hypothetical protein